MRKLYLAVVLLLLCSYPSFSQLYKVENAEKEQNATLIVEGKVVEQTAFWNSQRSMIFTANKIKVYKVFKGELATGFIEVLTQGGTVGDVTVQASDLLDLNRNEIGVFFCFPNHVNLKSPATGNLLFDVYASAQGFFQYDLNNNRAADPFNTYNNIVDGFYPVITSLTKQGITIVDPSFNAGNFRNGLASRTNASITSFTPTTVNAGATLDPATNVLTINGSGFGNLTSATAGQASVLFADGNSGGSTQYEVALSSASEFVSWSDNQIKVKVPTRASTGSFSVKDAAGNITTSPGAIIVNYSILTAGSKQSNLIDANGSGGYTMSYSSNMSPEATTTFNRALETWIEVAGANITKGSTTPVSAVTGDGMCVVMMDNAGTGNPPLSSGVLGVCYSFSNSCGAAYDVRKPEFDIVLRSSYSTGTTTFSYGPCAPTGIDLETVILHELGHGLNLGHINDGPQGSNPGKLMHYAVSNGMKRVSPDYSAYRGALYAINGMPTNYGPCTSVTNMVPLTATVDAKDEVPASFPLVPTSPALQVNFDLEHATSNKYNDPPHNIILCSSTSTNITNNLYFAIKTSVLGTLSMTVSNFQVIPASAATECTGGLTPTFRLALFQLDAPPASPDDYADPISCLSFTGNSILSTISGLLPNTNYLLYVDGRANAKATFTITFNGTALPLTLEKFTGEAKPDHNRLMWSVATFNNVEKLVLQRSSNGTEFQPLFEQSSLATSTEYSYRDFKPFAGKNYYRLATYNKDGSVQYSNVVLLNREDNVKVNVYPNPVANNISLSVNTAEKLNGLEIRLYNNLGQLMLTRKMNAAAGITNIHIPVTTMARGTYRLVLADKDNQIISSKNIQKL